jgi:hypothetical protein
VTQAEPVEHLFDFGFTAPFDTAARVGLTTGDGSTGNDQCTSGSCAGVDLCDGVTCTGGDQCNDAGTCDTQTGACSAATPVADTTSCDDGDGSTSNDQCTSGTCAGQVDIDQDKDQQKCIASQAAYLGKIAKAQAKENASCVKNQGKGKLDVTVADCVESDAKDKIDRLQTKFEQHQTDPDKGKCGVPPDFAYVAAADVVAAVKGHQIDFFNQVIGTDPESVIVDATDKSNKYAVLCQATIMKASDRLVQNRLKRFGVCLKKGLKAKDPADRISSAATAEQACWSASGPSGADKILKAVEKHADLNAKKCAEKGVAFDDTLGGECSGESSETDLALCIDEISACTACLMINNAFDFDLDCDALDNGLNDGSCGGAGGSPAGAYINGPVLF